MKAEERDLYLVNAQIPNENKWEAHYRDDPKPILAKTTKKPKYEKAYELITKEIENYKSLTSVSTFITAEYIFNATLIEMGTIKKVFMQLNREGVLSQAINHSQHGRSWVASKYEILK